MKDVKPGPAKHAAIGLRGKGGHLGISFHQLANRKTDCNNGSEFGSDMYGASYDWPDADHATREKIFQYHKDYTLGLLWFLGHDERLPLAVRTEMQRWGLPKDEFTDTGHWPHQLYVREARRMISDYVVTEHDAKGGPHPEDGVALASYPLDSHGVTLYVDDAGVLHRERGFYVGGFTAFPISYRALRPKASECENLLALSCLSASHAAYGSVRMEPVFMMLGHAAGAAASIAIDEKVTLQQVPYPALRARLLAEKQVLEPKARLKTTSAPASAPATAAELSVQLQADVAALVKRKVTDDAGYWLANAQKGRNCDGARVEALLRSMALAFDANTQTTEQALQVLTARKILSSPVYWRERATADRRCSGVNVRAVIRNFVRLHRD